MMTTSETKIKKAPGRVNFSAKEGRVEEKLDTKKTTRYAFVVQAETIRKANLRWRKIIFLPFNIYWQLLQATLILITTYVDSYNFLFVKSLENLFTIFTLAYCFFIVDCILLTIHRLWGRVARAYHHRRSKWLLLCVDWIAIIPVRIVYYIIYNTNDVNFTLTLLILSIDMLRVYKANVYINHLPKLIGVNQKLITVLGFNFKLLLFVNGFSVLWTLFVASSTTPWEEYLIRSHDIRNNNLVKYLYSLAIIFQYFTRQIITNLTEVPFHERVFNLIAVSAGFISNEIIYPSKLISAHIKREQHTFEYKTNMELVKRSLHNLGTKPVLTEKVIKYYLDFWNICSGLKYEKLLKTLPICMQKDLCLDINWDPIQHSHAFRHCGINFKRELSLRMINEFLHPGDYIYRRGTTNARAVYIVSGVVQIMSELDGVSALMSFSSGTFLGGVNTVIPNQSVADIRCATYCEVRTVGARDLIEVLKNYPWESRNFFKKVSDRFEEAKLMVAIKKERRMARGHYFLSSRDEGMKWLKRRWRQIAKIQKKVEKKEDIIKYVNELPMNPEFTSKYLDMIVLSGEMELKRDRFCLRCRWPFVIDPESDFLEVWLIFMTVLILIESLFLPYYAAFHRTFPSLFRRFLIFMSYIYIVDLYIQFVTAVKEQGLIIVEPMALVRHKLKSLRYVLELFSTLPIGLSLWLFGFDERFSSLMELLRLLKSWRIVYYIIILESDIKHKNPKVRFIRHFLSLIGLIYLFSCFMYLKSCYVEECDLEGWYESAKRQLAINLQTEEIVCFLNSFTYSLFFTFSVSTRASLTTVKVWTVTDVIAVVIITIIFINGSEYAFAEITATTLLDKKLEQDFQELIAGKDKFMMVHSISKNASNCFDSYLKLQWKYNLASGILLNKPVFSDASRDLKTEIFQQIGKILKTVPLFAGENKEVIDFVKKNSENAKLYMLPRNMSIVTAGLKATSLNIVLKGYCRMISHTKEDLAKFPDGILIGPGSCFPVPELVCNKPSIVTVITASECEVITVEADDLVKSIRVNRLIKKDLLSVVNSYHRVQQMSDNALSEKSIEITDTKSLTFPPIKKRDVYGSKDRLLKFTMMPYTFMPDGIVVYYWEIFRVFLAVLSCNYFILYYTLMMPTIPDYCHIIGGILDFLSFCDVYLRLHVCYYEEDGILIQNPKMIIKNYVRHSFIIDFLSSLPFYGILRVSKESDRAWFIITVFKSMPFYRVNNFFCHLKTMPDVNKYIPHFLYYTISLMTIMNIVANIIAQYFCRFRYKLDENNYQVFDKIECMAPLMQEIQMDKTPLTVLSVGLFIAVAVYTATRCTPLRAMNGLEMYSVIVGVTLGIISRCWFSIQSIVLIFGGGKEFSQYMSRVSTFLKFMNDNEVDHKLTRSVLASYQYVWNYMEGGSVHEVIQKVHPSIRMEILQQMYSSKLQMVEALSAGDKSFFSTLAMKVQEHYATKGSIICDKYHLNDNIYFIWQGEINVIVSEAIPPITIGVGGMFGCFRNKEKLRHMFKFKAKVHTHCLVIKAETFYELLQGFKEVKREFTRRIQPHKEYIQGKSTLQRDPQHSSLESLSKYQITTRSKTYQIGDYILSFVVPYLTFVFVFSYLAHSNSISSPYALYCLDALYCIRIIAALWIPFNDKKTGVLITDRKLIRRRYLIDSRFYCDVLSVIPLDMFHYLNSGQEKNVYFINRLLKIVSFAKYINYRRLKLHVLVFSKNVDFLLLLPLCLYIISCTWTILYHWGGYFYYMKEDAADFKSTGWKAIVISVNLILSLFSKTLREGTTTIRIVNPLAFLFISVLIIVESILFSVTFGLIANIYDKSRVLIADYENKLNKFKAYLKKSDLSPPLMESAWQYVKLHWKEGRGRNLPRFLENSSYTVKTQIMYDIYGHHLQNNLLFKNTHQSFLIQLSARLKRTLYFPDNYIVVQGDVEQKVFFINSGEVELIIRDSFHQEDNVGVLTVGDCFGLVQGLYDAKPLIYTYKARTEVDILTLDRDDWADLRAAFWLDTKLIYKRARTLPNDDEYHSTE